MKRRLLFAIGILLLLGFMSVNVVQAPWVFTETEWEDQYTINVDEFMSWGANHSADGEKWNITCQVVGDGAINFLILSHTHYETYISQSGFVLASVLLENVQTVNVELDFTSSNPWWIVIENAYGLQVTIDLKVDVYTWQEPPVNIPGTPQYNSMIFLLSGLVGGILLAIIGSIYLSLGRRSIKKRAEQAGIVMDMDEPTGFSIDPIALEGAAYCIIFIIVFISAALGISLTTIIQQVQDIAILVLAIAGGAALWGLGIGTVVFSIIHIRKLNRALNDFLLTKSC